ncbi:MAG: hypothetical protein NW215_11050 [Hyphomicrobiales bacterium]|nr:hypothetical protein [Hyphomicrobiales bacterium]
MPILGLDNASEREALFRLALRIAVDVEKPTADFTKLYRHAPEILHRNIMAVRGFTGREAKLEAIGQALEKGVAALTNSKSASAALRGLGGVDKTVSAREYAWRKRERYHGASWGRAETLQAMLRVGRSVL